MNSSIVQSSKRYITAAVVIGILVLIYLVINLFVIGGDEFVIRLNSSITAILATLTTVFAYSLWKLVNTGRNNRLLWGGLLAGWTAWAIAEILWLAYGYLYQDVPYPSPADFFWLVGYLPMGYALYSRRKEIPTKLSQTHKITLWAISLITILASVNYILVPIIQTSDGANWLESILNLFYPLADLGLLILVIQLIVVYRGGDYGFGWSLLTAGFILQPISDLIFSFASLSDLYYPDQKVNLLSTIGIDVPYTLSYLVWFLGLYVIRLVLGSQKPFEDITQLHLIPNTSILIFLKKDNKVLSTSNDIYFVSDVSEKTGLSLAELLDLPEREVQPILDQIQMDRKITDWPVTIKNRPGVSPEAYLSGIATISPDGEYSGCNLVMRILVEDDYTRDDKLSKEQKFMVSHLRKISGSSERDQIRKLILDYHLAHLRQLHNLAFRTGGAQLSLAFFEHLKKIDSENQWELQLHPETLVLNGDYQLALLREALPLLLKEAKTFVSQLSDPTTVEAEMLLVSSQFSQAVHRNVEFYS